MPSSFKKRPIRQYPESALEKALHKIHQGNLTIRAASRMFDVPRGTLQDRLHGRVSEGPRRMGPDTVLTIAEEKKLVEWLIDLVKCGFPRKVDDLLNTVQKIVLSDNRKTPFKDGRPGKKWYNLFLRRNPGFHQREPQAVSKGRGIITEEAIRKWFNDLESFLTNQNNLDILQDPNRILNGDETSFSMCPKTGKVIAPKGWKNVYQLQQGNEKETITVLLVFSASGAILPPMVVFPYVRPPKAVTDSMPPDWFLGRSDSGWMKSDIFFEYVANGVNKWIKSHQIKKPVLLFVDGHKTHLTMEVSEFCANNGIILYALPANSTHIMQPADVSVFKPLKCGWKKTVRDWLNQTKNINSVLTKVTFCPLLASLLQNLELTQTIKHGFKKCGLYPMTPDAIDYSKCIQNVIENLPVNTVNEPSSVACKLPSQHFLIAETVIKAIEANLSNRAVDIEVIIEEIRKSATLAIQSPAHEAENNFEDCNNLMQEIYNPDGIVPGINSIDENGILIPTKGEDCNVEIISVKNSQNTLQDTIPENGQNYSFIEPSLHESSTRDQNIENLNDFQLDTQMCKVDNRQNQTESFKIKRSENSISPHFHEHLFYPKPITSKKRKLQQRAPSAISSADWQEFMNNKEKEKVEKCLATLKRKEERGKNKSEKKRKKEPWKFDEDERMKEKCAACEVTLISDEEDDDFKSIGCDICPNWFHFKCTPIFTNNNYEDIKNIDFSCSYCTN